MPQILNLFALSSSSCRCISSSSTTAATRCSCVDVDFNLLKCILHRIVVVDSFRTRMQNSYVVAATVYEYRFQVVCQRVYSHKAQVLDIVASPTSTQQFLSAHAGDDGALGCTLWSMQDLHSAVVMTLTSPLEELATFSDALAGIRRESFCNSSTRHPCTQLISSALIMTSYIVPRFRVFQRMPLHQVVLGK